MARPRKVLTDEQIAQVEKLAAVMTQEQIADFLGIRDRTLRQRIADSPAVAAAYKKGRAQAIGAAGANLLTLVRKGNLGAICFYLKTQAGWRETTRTELTGAEGGPISSGVLAVPMSPDASQWAAGAFAQQAALVARPATVEPTGDGS